MVNNKASRVVSSDPFTIREFKEDCTFFNKGHHNTDTEMFTVICEKDQLYEIAVSKGSGADKSSQIMPSPTGIQLLGVFKDPDNEKLKLTCYDSTYYYEKQLYAVVCESPKQKDRRGDVFIFLVKRIELPNNKIEGKQLSMVRIAKSGKIAFNEKRHIKMVKFAKGQVFDSEYQFMLYDEPFIYQGHQTVSKDNLFFLIMSVTGESGKEKFKMDVSSKSRTATLINIGDLGRNGSGTQPKIAEFIDLYRVVSYECIDGMLLISGYFDNVSNLVTSVKCRIDTTTSKDFQVAACMKIKSKKKTDLGF